VRPDQQVQKVRILGRCAVLPTGRASSTRSGPRRPDRRATRVGWGGLALSAIAARGPARPGERYRRRMQAVDQGPTGLDYITLIIAVFGAVLGAAAFVWQIASFKMSGPRIVVRLAAGWIGPSGALVFEVQDTWEPIDRPNENFIEECFAVQVHNAGRMPASITGWWLQIGPASLGQHVSPWNKPCPHRLEAYAEETWFVDRDQVLSVAQRLPAESSGASRYTSPASR